jgi:hypothetical protein
MLSMDGARGTMKPETENRDGSSHSKNEDLTMQKNAEQSVRSRDSGSEADPSNDAAKSDVDSVPGERSDQGQTEDLFQKRVSIAIIIIHSLGLAPAG